MYIIETVQIFLRCLLYVLNSLLKSYEVRICLLCFHYNSEFKTYINIFTSIYSFLFLMFFKIFISVDFETLCIYNTFIFLLLIMRSSINLTQMRLRIFHARSRNKGTRRFRSTDGRHILCPDSNDTATCRLSCRFLMSTTRDIVRRFKISISDLSRPQLVVAVVPLARSETGFDIQRGCRF